MSTSYEATITCDVCRDHRVTGEPMESPEKARQSAIQEARNESWDLLDDDQYKCVGCKEREGAA